MADISQVKLPNNSVYNLKDANAIHKTGNEVSGDYLVYNGTSWVSRQGTASDVGAIAAPSSANNGDFLVYNGSAWVAQSLSTWQGGSY